MGISYANKQFNGTNNMFNSMSHKQGVCDTYVPLIIGCSNSDLRPFKWYGLIIGISSNLVEECNGRKGPYLVESKKKKPLVESQNQNDKHILSISTS